MANLTTFVHVHRPDGSVVFGPGDDVPAWAREQITRPDVWDDVDPGEASDSAPDTGDEESDDGAVQEPPRAGRGSGVDAWRAFAAAKEVEVPEDASRDDIVELLEAEGVIEPVDGDA